MVKSGQNPPATDALEVVLGAGPGASWRFEDARAGVLESTSKVGGISGHQRDDVVHAAGELRGYVVQAHRFPGPWGVAPDRGSLVRTGLPPKYGTSRYAVGRLSWERPAALHAGIDEFSASRITSPIGRLTRSPRSDGMMQKVQRWLQPSGNLE